MTYASVVLADNPINFWRMADLGGGLAHDIGSAPKHQVGLAGTAVFHPELGYSGPSSDGGSCELGAQAAFRCDQLVLQAASISLECWVWIAAAPGNDQVCIAWDYTADTIAIGVDAAGHAKAYSNGLNVVAAAALSLQTWHQLAAVYTAGSTTLYVDGAAAGTNGTAVALSSNLEIWLARTASGVAFFNGWLSECAVYNYALIAAQVANHYAAADQRTQSPIFQAAAGTFPGSGGGVVLNSADLAAILAAVRRVATTPGQP